MCPGARLDDLLQELVDDPCVVRGEDAHGLHEVRRQGVPGLLDGEDPARLVAEDLAVDACPVVRERRVGAGHLQRVHGLTPRPIEK